VPVHQFAAAIEDGGILEFGQIRLEDWPSILRRQVVAGKVIAMAAGR
jgi:hypothetical protein